MFAKESRRMTTARPAKARNEGQWALGDREPLNPNEEFKQAGPPLEVRERIENIYAKQGFDSIDKTTCGAACAGGASTPSANRDTTAASPVTRTSTCSRPNTS
jgi:hypothetical protein